MGVPLLAIGAGLVLLAPPLDSSMTEFYVLGRDDLVSDYPYQVSAGHDVRVTLGVANRAGAASTYRFEVWDLGQWGTGEGSLIQSSPPFELEPGATLERPVSWAMMSLGDDRLVEVRLFEGSDPAPARELKLWMTLSS